MPGTDTYDFDTHDFDTHDMTCVIHGKTTSMLYNLLGTSSIRLVLAAAVLYNTWSPDCTTLYVLSQMQCGLGSLGF